MRKDLSQSYFEALEYPRSHINKLRSLNDILVVGVVAVICRAERCFFSEDASRKRNENAAQNYSIILKIALNLFKNDKSTKQGIAGKRLKAA